MKNPLPILIGLLLLLLHVSSNSLTAQLYAGRPMIKASLSSPELTDSIMNMVYIAHEEANCTILEIYEAFLNLKDTGKDESFAEAWDAHPDFPVWLGKSQPGTDWQKDIEEKLETMKGWLESSDVMYRVHLGAISYCHLSHSTAYTSQLSRKRVINLCPHWFKCRPKQKVSTIIHELVHKMGHGHPEGTVMPSQAIILARSKPEKARRSPENFEGLAESFYCKWRNLEELTETKK